MTKRASGRRDARIRRQASGAISGRRLRDLCAELHAFFRAADVSALQKAQFSTKHFPAAAMTPREACAISCATMSIMCPWTNSKDASRPRVGRLSPGDRDHRSRGTTHQRPADDRLSQDVREELQRFPGLRTEVQGLYREVDEKGAKSVLHLCRERAVRLKRRGGEKARRPVGLAAA